MDKVYDFPDRATIEQEAAEWLVRLDSEKMLEEGELQQLREWMRRSPAHRDELTSFGEFWSKQSLVALPISLEALYYAAEPNQENSAQASWYGKFGLAAVAATLVIGVGLSLMVGSGGLLDRFNPSEPASELYLTAVGQQKTISLVDGSTVYLNTNSQLKVDFDSDYRNILLLQGEAHFEVAKQAERPFRVYAGRGRIQAVGTAFTVHIRDSDKVDVMVTEGSVALAALVEGVETALPDADSVPVNLELMDEQVYELREYAFSGTVDELGFLEAGQASTIIVAQKKQENEPPVLDNVEQVDEQELERLGSWRSGLLIFAGNSLEEVVEEISRYTTLTIEIVDPELKAIRIGGRFSVSSTRELFDALEANFDLKVKKMDYNRVQISLAQ